MAVIISNDGGGEVTLYPGRGRSDEEIEQIAGSLRAPVFARAEHAVRLGDNGGGLPLVRIEAHGVYPQARPARVDFDTRALCRELRAAGYSTVNVSLTGPLVELGWSVTPGSAADSWTLVDDCDAAPRGALTMRARPERFWTVVAVLAGSIVALTTAYWLSRSLTADRRVPVVVLAIAAGVPTTWFGFRGQAVEEDAFVAGQLDDLGGWLPLGLVVVVLAVCGTAITLPAVYLKGWNDRRKAQATRAAERSLPRMG